MTDNTQPEALRLAEMLTADEWPGHVTLVSYAQECVTELRRQHARIAELESELEAVGAGGVQALSAAPNGWESVIDEARSGLQDSEPSAFDNSGYRAFAETVLDAVEEGLSALAASPTPTPPAEQAAQVIIDFSQVGTAGPFPVVNGRVSLPDSTMQDLVRMLRPTYEAEQQAAPRAAPWEQNAVSAEWLEQAAPQQEAQEPVAWQGVHDQTDLYYTKPLQADVRPLYAAPQPAPAELERLRERISKMGLDVDRAMRGHVNEQSPLGTTRLAAIAALAKPAPAPLSDDAKDAARWRWLRENWFTMTSNYQRCITFKVGEPRWSDLTEEELDAAIDAALAAQGGKV